MTALREIERGSQAFERFTAALKAADLPTDDLTAEPFRSYSADDLAWGGVGAGSDALLRRRHRRHRPKVSAEASTKAAAPATTG